MDRWIEIEWVRMRDGDELVLRRRAGVFEIRLNGWELMSNRAHRSEEAMACIACERLGSPARRVLVAGLGMGYTLRAVLDAVPEAAEVVVAELIPEVVRWNRGPIAHLAGRPLDDPRVTVQCGDVADLVRTPQSRFDLILLDIDNGPEAVMLRDNELLYHIDGLRLIRTALNAAGILAVWSAGRAPQFEERLQALGLSWEAVDIAARGSPDDPMHTIYLIGERLAGPPRP